MFANVATRTHTQPPSREVQLTSCCASASGELVIGLLHIFAGSAAGPVGDGAALHPASASTSSITRARYLTSALWWFSATTEL